MGAQHSNERGPWRWVLLVLGHVFSALALAGAFLPVLPTTPFLLLAAACFARSSERFHTALLENRIFGPYIRQWEEERSIPREAKRKAVALIVLSFGFSIYAVEALWLRVMLVVIALALLTFLARLPSGPASKGP